MMKRALLSVCICVYALSALAQLPELKRYNVVWDSQSKNSSESMPCGGGDIGLNVWVEKGDLLFYISKSGTFDENNSFLKLGRVRVKLYPNPFEGQTFRQELILQDGYVKISGNNGKLNATINLWVDVYRPVIHVEVNSNQPVKTEVSFESWRHQDRALKGKENNQNSWKWAPQGTVKTFKDDIAFAGDGVRFYHQNKDTTVFDATVKQQGLDGVKKDLFNPLKGLIFGGSVSGEGLKPAGGYSGVYAGAPYQGWRLMSGKASRTQSVEISLHISQGETLTAWQLGLAKTEKEAAANPRTARLKTLAWWKEYWKRSFIYIEPAGDAGNTAQWQTGKNYQLFRYMLGCNAFSQYPTKFNGGLFTYDPVYTDSTQKFTPDFRNWGGGLMTAQNQRLVYWPMLKSGDWDVMKPQFDFYLRALRNAELRTKTYWNHNGASFTEQLESFGLPNSAEYGWKRPANYDKGMEYNAWLEYEWDTALEFCMMMLEQERYAGKDIKQYISFIESCLTFFNEHYQYLAKQRGSKAFDADGHLVLYPGSGGETYKMAYNATSTIAGLKTVLSRLVELPETYMTNEKRKEWQTMLNRIPPITFREFNGHKTISPALHWERINNTEPTQLYPVFPWGMYGVGKADLDVALDTWKYDTLAIKFRSGIGWKQDNIFAARLGLTKEAAELTTFKLKDSGRRFPAFWGPGYDWTPDHNWGGSGMIGLLEMLLQTDDKKIILFPAWPKDWDVHFKLHAPYQTTVEATVKKGKLVNLKVFPESRAKDVVVML